MYTALYTCVRCEGPGSHITQPTAAGGQQPAMGSVPLGMGTCRSPGTQRQQVAVEKEKGKGGG